MPLRLDSITNNSQDSSLIAWILQSGTQECDSAFATPDKKYIHRIVFSFCIPWISTTINQYSHFEQMLFQVAITPENVFGFN